MQKIKFFNVKWILKNKNLQWSCHLELLKIKNMHIRKISMHFINKPKGTLIKESKKYVSKNIGCNILVVG
jgi:hypothetical protein